LSPQQDLTENLSLFIKSHRLNKKRIEKILSTIKENPHSPTLRLHKLSGTNNHAASVDRDIRIILHLEGDVAVLMRIGSHDEVY